MVLVRFVAPSERIAQYGKATTGESARGPSIRALRVDGGVDDALDDGHAGGRVGGPGPSGS
ncbi:hypothetical protein FXF52_33145 [Micromonospora sp. MP36]|nr:hypothetical protein FXF52_33145 [Micromonospora sp. MP36]